LNDVATLEGRQVYSKVFRGGDLYELDAGCNTAYDFDLQEIAPFPEQTKLHKTDMVRVLHFCFVDSASLLGVASHTLLDLLFGYCLSILAPFGTTLPASHHPSLPD
jgi:hypothetical protein